MGLLETFLGKDNAAAQWAGQNQNLLGALSAGLAQGSDFGQGVANALSYAPNARMLDIQAADKLKEKAKEEQATNYTRDWLKKNRPDLLPGLEMGISPSDLAVRALTATNEKKPIEVNGQLIDPDTFEVMGDFRTVEGKGGNAEVALQPTWMQDGQGNWVLGQLSKDGSIVQTKIPEGMHAASPGLVAGDKAGTVADAKASATARAALPSAEQNYEIAIRAADSLLKDKTGMGEQFGNILGLPQQMTGAFPGTAKANFRVQLDQLTGQAFLNIRQALKGAGAVTDYEGQRGEVALSRAQAAAEKGDQKAFEQAVIEFKDSITKGLQLMRDQAQGGYSAGSPAVSGPGGSQTSTGVQWSVEP